MEKPIIDKGIPMPDRYANRGYMLALFEQMQTGDSVYFDSRDGRKLVNAAQYAAQKFNCKYAIRKEENGYRVWKLEGQR